MLHWFHKYETLGMFVVSHTALGTQLPVLLDLYSLHKCVCVSRWWLFNRGMQCPSSRQTALLFLQQREHVSSLSTQDVGLDLLKKKKKPSQHHPHPLSPSSSKNNGTPPHNLLLSQEPQTLGSHSTIEFWGAGPLLAGRPVLWLFPWGYTHTQFSVNSGAFSCKPHLHLSIFISFKWKLPPAWSNCDSKHAQPVSLEWSGSFHSWQT